ncbi:MAG: helix-turn-helix domain-containing protein [Lewinella sp.]|nr:helix-turn-helix domain-containing protein [Lewinella sp.]
MNNLKQSKKPSKDERKLAMASYSTLANALEEVEISNPEIEIEETGDRIKVPRQALQLLADILQAMGNGQVISIVPIALEMTTQAAAEQLGCSRPHLVKLLEAGEIPFTMVGRHRRVKFEDVMAYKERMQAEREKLLTEMMNEDEEAGLYDS